MFSLVFQFMITMLAFANNMADDWNIQRRATINSKLSYNVNEYFPSLENYQVNAAQVTQKQYPWVARVIHSRTDNFPHMCTAVCIDEAIFITAARCINGLKVDFTTLIYMSRRLNVAAFVIPSEPTKQMFDDIGFIVINSTNFIRRWAIMELFDASNRTDERFKWFSELEWNGGVDYKVVGYAKKKGTHRIPTPERQYDLTELSVIVNLELCAKILTEFGKLKGYNVPCYHSCTFKQFKEHNNKCFNYHGVEGGAVFDTISNKLLGIAIWGSYFTKWELPVGFSVVNSENFFKDFMCARLIRDDNGVLITKGYYQKLCNTNK